LAPKGWRIPKEQDFKDLQEQFGGRKSAAKQLRAPGHWRKSDKAKNKSGFSAIACGSVVYDLYNSGLVFDDRVINQPEYTYGIAKWWTSNSVMPLGMLEGQLITHSVEQVVYKVTTGDKYSVEFSRDDWFRGGFSVRCIKE